MTNNHHYLYFSCCNIHIPMLSKYDYFYKNMKQMGNDHVRKHHRNCTFGIGDKQWGDELQERVFDRNR